MANPAVSHRKNHNLIKPELLRGELCDAMNELKLVGTVWLSLVLAEELS